MKNKILLLISLCLLIAPTFAGDITFENISAVYGSPYCESGSGCPADNLIDGNTASWLTLDVSHGMVRIYADQYYSWESCDVYHGRPDANREVLFRFNTSSNPVTTYGIAEKGKWTTINIPANISNVLYFSTTDAPWFGLNELKCTGTPVTVGPPAPPIVDFSCNVPIGHPYEDSPFNLVCTDNSTAIPAISSVQWDLTQPDGSVYSTANNTLTKSLTSPGWYSLEFQACNTQACGYANTTHLVNLSEFLLPITGLTVNLDVKNSISGALISDTSVGIKNTTTGVWRNSTAPTGLVYFDSTDPGYAYPLSQNQTITLAASKTGYSPASTTFAIPYDNYRAYLYLVPGTVTNATGAGTVVVSVLRQKTGLPLSGVSVVMDSEGGGQIGMTNSAGSVTLMNVTAGSRTIIASDSGYQTVEKTFDLTAGETKLVSVELVLDGETPVPTYVTPGPTYDPGEVPTYNPDDPFNETYLQNGNYTPGQLNQRSSAGLMAMIGTLLEMWPALLILGFLKAVKSVFE